MTHENSAITRSGQTQNLAAWEHVERRNGIPNFTIHNVCTELEPLFVCRVFLSHIKDIGMHALCWTIAINGLRCKRCAKARTRIDSGNQIKWNNMVVRRVWMGERCKVEQWKKVWQPSVMLRKKLIELLHCDNKCKMNLTRPFLRSFTFRLATALLPFVGQFVMKMPDKFLNKSTNQVWFNREEFRLHGGSGWCLEENYPDFATSWPV